MSVNVEQVEPATPEEIVVTVEPDDFLLYYSEWLDGEGLIVKPDANDERTHEELVREFLGSEELASLLLARG